MNGIIVAVNGFLKNLLLRLGKRERFYAVSLVAGEGHFARFSVDLNRREIEVQDLQIHSFPADDVIAGLNLVRRFLRPLRRHRGATVLVSLDPAFATTVQASVALLREKPEETIDDADLDNRVAQGIWRLFNGERSRAAKKMLTSDLDVIMTEVAVKHVKLDDHRVVNPVGFPARTIEVLFSGTFSPRICAEELRNLVPAPRVLFMGEHGVFEADLLSRVSGDDHFLLAEIFSDRCHVFMVQGTSMTGVAAFSWGKENLINAITEEFLVSRKVAEHMFQLYLIRQASGVLLRRMEKLLQGEFLHFVQILAEPIEKHVPKAVYLFSSFELPPFVFSPGFRGTFSERIRFLPVPTEMFFDELGFSVTMPEGMSVPALFAPLAAFLEFYFIPRGDKMNMVARRHARWLVKD
jgi:hypothetical protein